MDFWTDIWPALLGAEQMLTSVGDDMSRLPQNVRIFLFVNGAQGVIDNGGHRYFLNKTGQELHHTMILPMPTRR